MPQHLARTALAGVLLTGMALLGTGTTPAGAAEVIDAGNPVGGVRCSDTEQVDTTCLLPLGPPVSADGAITSIAVADFEPLLLIARPLAGLPGQFTVVKQLALPDAQAFQAGSAVFYTAVPVHAGDQLVLVDPIVSTNESSVDLESASDSLASLTTGEKVGVKALGRVTIEPDADQDGYGDETADLCPGVTGGRCAPGTASVTLAGPAYAPVGTPMRWTWTVTNTSPTAQPFVVNLTSPEETPELTAPDGAICSPGTVASSDDAVIAPSARSPLIQRSAFNAGAAPSRAWGTGTNRPGEWHCRLPVLAPGASTSGTIGGRGGTGPHASVKATVLVPMITAEGTRASTLSAAGAYDHELRYDAPVAWRPANILVGPVSSTGRMLVTLLCGGPALAASCTVEDTSVVRAIVGGAVLGRVAKPVAAKPGQTVTVSIKLSKRGMRWLATHTGKVDVAMTTSWPGEPTGTKTARVKLERSKALKRKLAKLAGAKQK